MQNQQDNFTHIQVFGVLDAVILLWQLHLQPVSLQQQPEQPSNSLSFWESKPETLIGENEKM